MTRDISSIWLSKFPDLRTRLTDCVDSAVCRACGPVVVFFRADDVAVPGMRLARLMALFATLRVPLSLAVVPAWLTRPRWKGLEAAGAACPSLWCWHQHGWRHRNHEQTGKKQEFGPSRTASAIRTDILKGRRRLEALMGRRFYPIFTPPWNRCTPETLDLLKDLGYLAVSRDRKEPRPKGLPDFSVAVDLHTRKSTDPSEDRSRLLFELFEALSSGTCGVMLHHRRTNDSALFFLEILIETLKNEKKIALASLKDLAESGTENL